MSYLPPASKLSPGILACLGSFLMCAFFFFFCKDLDELKSSVFAQSVWGGLIEVKVEWGGGAVCAPPAFMYTHSSLCSWGRGG